MKLKNLEKSRWIGSIIKNLKLQIRKLGTARKLNYLFPFAFRAVAESVGIQNLASTEGKDKDSETGIRNLIWCSQKLHDYLLVNYFMWRRIQSLGLQGTWN